MAVLISLSMMVSVSGRRISIRQFSEPHTASRGERIRTAEAGLASTQVEEQNDAKREEESEALVEVNVALMVRNPRT